MAIESSFDPSEIKRLFRPEGTSQNGQITIIGGSTLFHGAPLFSLTTASRINDMVFFSSPEPSMGDIAKELKSKLFSFIWVPWDEVGDYIEKSDAVLIGPGFMRYRTEKNEKESPDGEDEASNLTKEITRNLLAKYPDKKWVIDAGSLQVLEPNWIPKNSILTPNAKEYQRLFGDMDPETASKKYECTILLKGVTDRVYSKGSIYSITGGNAGLSKGGTGDTLAGLVTALYAKNEALLSASAASFVIKKTAEVLSEKVGTVFNSDDLSNVVPEVYEKLRR